jgi:hypothetical protein
MKTPLILSMLLFGAALNACARIGRTLRECVAQYGKYYAYGETLDKDLGNTSYEFHTKLFEMVNIRNGKVCRNHVSSSAG